MLRAKQSMQMVVCTLGKTLLVLGAGVDQVPGFQKARDMGIYTIALDGNPNAAAKEHADEFHVVSIKHFDQIQAFLETSLEKTVDGVIAFGVDIASIIAKTADILNANWTIPAQSALLSEDKFLAKEFMASHAINIPPFKLVKTIEQIEDFILHVSLPIIIKPVDNSAARGISYVTHLDQVHAAFEDALKNSKSQKIIVEKFLAGPQISSESFVINGVIHNIGFADRNYDDMERFLPNIIENGGDLPSQFMLEKHKKTLKHYLKIIADTLEIKNGIIKGDLVIHNDELYIIEFALRLSGGNFSTIEIPENTGIDFIKVAIKLHLNMPISNDELISTKNEFISLRYKFSEDLNGGIIKEIIMPCENKNIVFKQFHTNVGDTIPTKTMHHASRLGYAIARGTSRQDAIQNAQQFLDAVRIDIE